MSEKTEDIIVNGVHGFTSEEKYTVPKEQELLEKLEWFKDQKLGFMTHIGLFNDAAIIESWILPDETNSGRRWAQENLDWDSVTKVKEQYVNMNKSFNPIRFEAERWAKFLKGTGFKYAIMPSKHHDGFCLWDTKYTDYKTTDESCPFHTHKNADMLGSLIKELKNEGVAVGAYFSKPDWHVESYWPKEYKKKSTHRDVGYEISENPELWEEFVQFTHNQLLEISDSYGPLDILWLDGGWVSKDNKGQDIRLEEVVRKIRKTNPEMLVCDRTCGGEMENYITPEQCVPEHIMEVPWESCITLGQPFSYGYEDQYKSATEVAHMFIDIITRGGNLVLNVAPQPDGRLPSKALRIITEFTDWVSENEEAIFATRPVKEAHENISYTQSKDGKETFMFYKFNENCNIPKYFYTTKDTFKSIEYKGVALVVEQLGEEELRVNMPPHLVDRKAPFALVFKVEL